MVVSLIATAAVFAVAALIRALVPIAPIGNRLVNTLALAAFVIGLIVYCAKAVT